MKHLLKRIALVCALFLSSYSHAELCVTFVDQFGVTGQTCSNGDPFNNYVQPNGYVNGLTGTALAQVLQADQERAFQEYLARYYQQQQQRPPQNSGYGSGGNFGAAQGLNPLTACSRFAPGSDEDIRCLVQAVSGYQGSSGGNPFVPMGNSYGSGFGNGFGSGFGGPYGSNYGGNSSGGNFGGFQLGE